MERKMISLSDLKKVLSPKEMKNVMGGSGGSGEYICCCEGITQIPCLPEFCEWSDDPDKFFSRTDACFQSATNCFCF